MDRNHTNTEDIEDNAEYRRRIATEREARRLERRQLAQDLVEQSHQWFEGDPQTAATRNHADKAGGFETDWYIDKDKTKSQSSTIPTRFVHIEEVGVTAFNQNDDARVKTPEPRRPAINVANKYTGVIGHGSTKECQDLLPPVERDTVMSTTPSDRVIPNGNVTVRGRGNVSHYIEMPNRYSSGHSSSSHQEWKSVHNTEVDQTTPGDVKEIINTPPDRSRPIDFNMIHDGFPQRQSSLTTLISGLEGHYNYQRLSYSRESFDSADIDDLLFSDEDTVVTSPVSPRTPLESPSYCGPVTVPPSSPPVASNSGQKSREKMRTAYSRIRRVVSGLCRGMGRFFSSCTS